MPLEIFGDFGFVGGSNTTANPEQDAQLCINWYPEASPSQKSKSAVSLLGCPGLTQLVAAPGGGAPGFSSSMSAWPQPAAITTLPVRGLWVLPGSQQALAVIGSGCYLVYVAHAGTLALLALGTLVTSSGPVCIRDNGTGGTAVIVDGANGYYYGFSSASPLGQGAFKQITDPAFLGASRVSFIDGWWIFNQPNSQKFYTNSQAYSLTFDGSYYAFSDSGSDQLMAVMENKEELWLIGERTTAIWYNAGGQYFPFQRLVGTMVQSGTSAAQSVSRVSVGGQDSLIWLARSERGEHVIVRTMGFTTIGVSTPAVSDAIAKYSTVSDAIGYTYQEDGHEFYMLTFPTADRTWVYDATLPPELAWHQRLSWDPYAAAWHRHRSNAYMDFAGMRIVGDYQCGALYELTREAFTDAGWPLRAVRRAPHIWAKETRQRMFMARLQVDFRAGVGNASGMGSSPVATLRMSRDGGQSFGQRFPATLGAIGRTLARTIWRRLGFARDNVLEIEVIDPVNRDIVGATLLAFSETA